MIWEIKRLPYEKYKKYCGVNPSTHFPCAIATLWSGAKYPSSSLTQLHSPLMRSWFMVHKHTRHEYDRYVWRIQVNVIYCEDVHEDVSSCFYPKV